ncbi:MAG: hypothetical protein COT14_00090 [Candidatus Diapherotrites archaeon CG08_land_8_20_14_0_20_30_16]|nr:MAG: hypothetical protein COT14_00090 [Candidatus Diapherotrites archaeon CG08_land_8_20_14_0_20_30_16]
MGFELTITQAIYSFFNNLGLTEFWWVITNTYVILCIGFLLFAFLQRRWVLIAFYVGCNAIGFGLKELITLFYLRARPYSILNLDIKTNLTQNSFYSTHTFVAFISAFFIFFLTKNKVLRISGIVLAILISISRFALAQHYVSDVLAGFLIAFILYLIAKKVYEKYYTEKIE